MVSGAELALPQSTQGRLRQTGRRIAILDGACRAPFGKRFVRRAGVHTNMVNRSAPELFPAGSLVKKRFIRREARSAAPLV